MARPKEEEIIKAIRLTWDSLESHLEYAEKPIAAKHQTKFILDALGKQSFHKKCIVEYATVLLTLAKTL